MTRARPLLDELAEREMERWSRAAGVPPSMLGALGGIAGMSTMERAVHAVAMESERFRFCVKMLGGDADAWSAWVRQDAIRWRTITESYDRAERMVRYGYATPHMLEIGQRWARCRLGESVRYQDDTAALAADVALWALAYEIDERRATFTGETACAECGERGERVFWGRERTGFQVDVTGWGGGRWRHRLAHTWTFVRSDMIDLPDGGDDLGDLRRWYWAFECPCTGRRRPVTVSLRRALSRPSDPWPTLWMVNTDAMEANGWGDTVLPGGEFVPAWMCRWWRAFRLLALTGETPDAAPLFADLEALLPDLEARARDRGSQHGAAG